VKGKGKQFSFGKKEGKRLILEKIKKIPRNMNLTVSDFCKPSSRGNFANSTKKKGGEKESQPPGMARKEQGRVPKNRAVMWKKRKLYHLLSERWITAYRAPKKGRGRFGQH